MNVQPDVSFINYLKGAGGDTLKKCYQCATCSVRCPLSSDEKPFPRKEMIWAGWGVKENLLADPDVFLCHNCGDCSTYCPRGAKPAETLGAIRAYAYTHYGWPAGLAKLATSAKNLPMLIGIPALLTFVFWLLSGAMGFPTKEEFATYGYTHFFGHWEFKWYAKNIFFIVLLTLPPLALALFSLYKGLTNLWKAMAAEANIASTYRPSVIQFTTQFLWPATVEIFKHNRFKECTTNTDRVRGHLPLMLAFVGLFIVTSWSLVKQDILGLIWPSLHGPLPLTDPFKILANISAIALIFGTWVLWSSRSKSESEGKTSRTFYDWFLLWMIMAVGVTGLGAQVLRWINLVEVGYITYFAHLVTVVMLFLYLPYTKLAHIAYRTTAMAFERFRESSFAKPAIEQPLKM
ncbi:MAG: quinone-interacting membrane-bound oxidoreductase complex subunit QmoC [Desulfofustis sp. PB-SRB1]|mgnify:CR=1 FL=1|jgi:quinone-modifying oxidoreductase subunit QmoC|nr:quinone-interacting membrane-bound oxidoreductase complex subunit QmoC [Desulfofustis sp. PB-SRB1]MBM1002513.1 quinone-interacting membrane-bound oxidoreductase complex subunit QmoC [Desulfofustis sp. PB-SRB1]HBH28427.1 heterodisulfide reductase [Desulfofustis sp.]HBH30474.1 heterodisulfide reductase [Desulfofustis sp.]